MQMFKTQHINRHIVLIPVWQYHLFNSTKSKEAFVPHTPHHTALVGAHSWTSTADKSHAGYWVRLVTVGRLCDVSERCWEKNRRGAGEVCVCTRACLCVCARTQNLQKRTAVMSNEEPSVTGDYRTTLPHCSPFGEWVCIHRMLDVCTHLGLGLTDVLLKPNHNLPRRARTIRVLTKVRSSCVLGEYFTFKCIPIARAGWKGVQPPSCHDKMSWALVSFLRGGGLVWLTDWIKPVSVFVVTHTFKNVFFNWECWNLYFLLDGSWAVKWIWTPYPSLVLLWSGGWAF